MAKLVYADPAIRIRRPKSLIVYLPEEMKPFVYKTTRSAKGEVKYFPAPSAIGEFLTGFVHGKRASDLEERLAIAMDEVGLTYIFQYEVDSAYSLPNEGKILDFLVDDGGLLIPLEPGGGFFHRSPSQQEEERQRQAIINPILLLRGIAPLGDPRFQIPFDRPTSIADARDIIAAMFISI